MNRLSSKIITSIAYTIIGSEVVKDNLTVDNARKVGAAIGKAATATGKVVSSKASNLRNAVSERKAAILKSNDSPF